jgi:Holliday junction resolvasome RuvABC endonuclease subunit
MEGTPTDRWDRWGREEGERDADAALVAGVDVAARSVAVVWLHLFPYDPDGPRMCHLMGGQVFRLPKRTTADDSLSTLARWAHMTVRAAAAVASGSTVVIAVEEPVYPRNAHTQRVLTSVAAAVRAAAAIAGLTSWWSHPSTWKATVRPGYRGGLDGHGRADQKAAVRAAVVERFPVLSTADQDVVDAAGVAWWAWRRWWEEVGRSEGVGGRGREGGRRLEEKEA